MAARFFINGGVNNNWSNIANWSATSGGTGGQTVPTFSTTVTFDTHSPNCIIDIAANAQSLTCTSYSNTLTFNNILTINRASSVTLGSSMSFAGTSALQLNLGNLILTSNGKSIDVPVILNPSGNPASLTLSGNCTFNQPVTLNNAATGVILNGNTLILNSDFNINNVNDTTGTATIQLSGNSTNFSMVGGGITNNIIINTSGTITTNNVNYGLVYTTSGTGGILSLVSGSIGPISIVSYCTINTSSGKIWDELDFAFYKNIAGLNITLTSMLNATILNTLYYNSPNATISFSGGYGFNVSTLYLLDTLTLILQAGIEYIISEEIDIFGNTYQLSDKNSQASGSDICYIQSDTPGTQTFLTIKGATQQILNANITDVDSSKAQTVWGWHCVLSNTKNWNALSTQLPKQKTIIS